MSEPTDQVPAVAQESSARAYWAIVFVVLSLVALAAVPVQVGERVARVQRQIADVLDPAGALAARLWGLQARQQSRYQAYLLTGDATFRESYQAARSEERELYRQLTELARGLEDIEIREKIARLSTQSELWHFEHAVVFEEPLGTPRGLDRQRALLRSYGPIERATLELGRAIQAEIDAGRRAMDATRTAQVWISAALAALALGSTFVVARVGRGLRSLTLEAERRRRDALRSRREIDALLEATGDGVLGMDLEGRCISLNRAGVELVGYTENEVRGSDFHRIFHHTDADGKPRAREASPLLRALREGRRAHAGDDVLWRRDGTSFPARWALWPLLDGTDLRGGVLTFTDVTEIREKEDALRRAVEQREEVVSIVSHDLRNPLSVVTAAADLLLDLPLGADERRKQVEIIRRSAERMQRLIRDLLDVSRIEAGAFTVRASPEDPRPILEEIHGLFVGLASAKGIDLVVECPRLPPARIDRERVLQALSNLVDNAVRLTPPGGRVVLCGRRADDGSVELRVEDTGPGIAEPELQHLFDRFWQAEHNHRGSAGLGLSIVRGIAEAHGGEVTVVSQPGDGASFTLRLPPAESPRLEVRA